VAQVRFKGMPKRKVTGTVTHDRRVYVRLDCGHLRLINAKHRVPKVSHCLDCSE
jgi:hypothetical protein